MTRSSAPLHNTFSDPNPLSPPELCRGGRTRERTKKNLCCVRATISACGLILTILLLFSCASAPLNDTAAELQTSFPPGIHRCLQRLPAADRIDELERIAEMEQTFLKEARVEKIGMFSRVDIPGTIRENLPDGSRYGKKSESRERLLDYYRNTLKEVFNPKASSYEPIEEETKKVKTRLDVLGFSEETYLFDKVGLDLDRGINELEKKVKGNLTKEQKDRTLYEISQLREDVDKIDSPYADSEIMGNERAKINELEAILVGKDRIPNIKSLNGKESQDYVQSILSSLTPSKHNLPFIEETGRKGNLVSYIASLNKKDKLFDLNLQRNLYLLERDLPHEVYVLVEKSSFGEVVSLSASKFPFAVNKESDTMVLSKGQTIPKHFAKEVNLLNKMKKDDFLKFVEEFAIKKENCLVKFGDGTPFGASDGKVDYFNIFDSDCIFSRCPELDTKGADALKKQTDSTTGGSGTGAGAGSGAGAGGSGGK